MEARGVVAGVQFSRKPALCVQIMYGVILICECPNCIYFLLSYIVGFHNWLILF